MTDAPTEPSIHPRRRRPSRRPRRVEPLRPRDPRQALSTPSRNWTRVQVRNPVMFVVLIGTSSPSSSLSDIQGLRTGRSRLAVPDGHLRQLRRSHGRGPGQGPGRHAARMRSETEARLRRRRHRGAGAAAALPRVTWSSARPRPDPLRRRDHRGHRLGRRVRHHGRVGTGHPRIRRRPLGRHRRDQGPLRPHRRTHHGRTRATPSSTA